jgi:hypothetical protein
MNKVFQLSKSPKSKDSSEIASDSDNNTQGLRENRPLSIY